jgi:carboxyl-terminal processing protease
MAPFGTSYKLRSFFSVITLLLACGVAGVCSPSPQAAAKGDDDVSASLRDFTRVYALVEQNFADPLSADKGIYDGAIPGMLLTLDPHSHFFDPTALKAMRENQSGHYYGVGMEIVGRSNQVMVVHPFVGSPAYKAGLLPNDVIVNVSGKSTVGLDSGAVADLLRGARGTPVQIKVLRGEAGEPMTFDVVRDAIPRSSVPAAFMVKPGIGYIKLEEFIETTGGDFADALAKLGEDNLKGLILDLRANPGGLLTEAVSVAGHLLPKGAEVVSQHGRASQEMSYKATEGNHGVKYPIVVIVNSRSASASEIVSGALQDHDRAWILGDNTFGKGLVQTVYPLTENTGLALTTAKYYTPSGRLIQRDYSSVSFFDYYYRKNTAARNDADMKTTDSGRTVYGGGGISPDEKFEVPASPCVGPTGNLPACWGPLETDMYLSYTFANYSKHFFSVHKEKLPVGWNVDTTQMEVFHKWLLDQKIVFDEAQFTKEYEMIRRRLQGDIYVTAFNLDQSNQYELGTDPEVLAAVAALPKSQALLDSATKARERAQK